MRKEIIIGILALVTLVVGIWGFNFLKGSNMLKRNLEFYSYYNDVKELASGSAVTVNGFKIGSITNIELDPQDVSRVKVSYEVDKEIKVPANTIAVMRNTSIMGGRALELKFDKLCGDGVPCAQNGQEIKGNELGMIGSMVDFSEADPLVETVGQSFDVISNKLAGDTTSQMYGTYQNLDATVANLAKVTEQMSRLIYANNKSIEATLSSFAAISGNLEQNNQKINTILANLSNTSSDIAKMNLSGTVANANGALTESKKTIAELTKVATNANASLKNLEGIIAKINSTDGTMGKLINDKELYDNVESTTHHLSLLLQDLRLNPKRYVNVSVFGKKDKDYEVPEEDPAMKN